MDQNIGLRILGGSQSFQSRAGQRVVFHFQCDPSWLGRQVISADAPLPIQEATYRSVAFEKPMAGVPGTAVLVSDQTPRTALKRR
jgi:hypothetical protein